MKILIFGASGSGTTTLGKETARRAHFIHLDVDDYYWKKTTPPFLEKIPLKERNSTLRADFNKYKNVIVSGSMVSWGKEWKNLFDLAVFIHLNNETRMARLKQREIERYGEQLLTDKNIQQNSTDFLQWADQYENPDFEGRSFKVHNEWIELLRCKVLRIDGAMELKSKTEAILTAIANKGNSTS